MKKTKQDLIDAFWEIYSQKRIEKITVKEIVQKAGYNRSTFYQYFTDVYDVLENVENSLIPTLNEFPPTEFNGMRVGMDPAAYFEYFKSNKKYLSVLLSNHGDPSFTHKIKTALRPTVSALMGDNNYRVEFILSGMIGVMAYHITCEEKSDEEVLAVMGEMMSGIIDNSNF